MLVKGAPDVFVLCNTATMLHFNSLCPGRCGSDFQYVNFKHNLGIDILSIQENITQEWMPEDLVDGKFNIGSGDGLVLSGNKPSPAPVLPRCPTPYDITRPQWVNSLKPSHTDHHYEKKIEIHFL